MMMTKSIEMAMVMIMMTTMRMTTTMMMMASTIIMMTTMTIMMIFYLGTCRILEERKDLLMKVAKAGKSTDVKAAGLGVLSLAVFIACQDQLELLETMEFLQSLFISIARAPAGDSEEAQQEENQQSRSKKSKAPAAEVRTAAVRAWTLLLTTVPRELLVRTGYTEMCLAALGGLLHEDSVELREAAGEAAAVLYEALLVRRLGLFDQDFTRGVANGIVPRGRC